MAVQINTNPARLTSAFSENREKKKKSSSRPPMAKTLFLILSVAFLAVSLLAPVDAGGEFGWMPTVRSGGCDGPMGECGLDEFEMDSEISRRILATARYISYGALNKNTIPCSRRGASYYNCRPGAARNPYRRGCSAITRCRR